MGIKSILLPLRNDRSFEVLETAFIVADRFSSHINAVHISPAGLDQEPYIFSNLTGSLRDVVEKETREANARTAESVRQRFETACRDHNVTLVEQPTGQVGISASFEIAQGRPAHVLIEHARLADVTAMSVPHTDTDVVRQRPLGDTLEAVMLGSGRPVLMVPTDWQSRRCEHAVIGWNDSIQASRAIAMTIPWLEQMKSVSLVVARERMPGADRVVRYLATHGIEAQVLTLSRGTNSAGEALLQRCAEINADFLVVGAYSRARPRQLLFGGVTSHLMKHTNIVTVMVH